MEPTPKIEPLVEDLKSLKIGDFLKSLEYKRFLIKIEMETIWKIAIVKIKDNRGYYSPGFDHVYFDSIDALVSILNYLFNGNEKKFYFFVFNLLESYTNWSKEDLQTKNIIEDLKLLSTPQEIIDKIENLGNFYSRPVPQSAIPENIWNAVKLDSVLKKMDISIKKGEFNQTLTIAYSSLEGLFKAFVFEKIPNKWNEKIVLNKLSLLVRNYLKDNLEKQKIKYPDQMLNLITTITYAISSARNSFSDSHFSGETDKWLAEFARDCVHSIGRLIIKFIK